MTGTILLPLLVLVPMAGALLTYLTGRISKSFRNIFAVLVTVAEFATVFFYIKRLSVKAAFDETVIIVTSCRNRG